jgi:hypothetical protein
MAPRTVMAIARAMLKRYYIIDLDDLRRAATCSNWE